MIWTLQSSWQVILCVFSILVFWSRHGLLVSLVDLRQSLQCWTLQFTDCLLISWVLELLLYRHHVIYSWLTSVVGIISSISRMGKARFKGVNVTCPRRHNWIDFRYTSQSWVWALASMGGGGPSVLSVIDPCPSLRSGPRFIPVVPLLIPDS